MTVYLDYNATTPVDPEAAEVMAQCLESNFGNPSSGDHRFGWDAADALEQARDEIASCIGASPRGLFFSSGATESLNTVLRGFVGFDGWSSKKIITCTTEHRAVLEPCHWLARRTGIEVECLAVDAQGRLDLQQLSDSLHVCLGRKDVLVALMAANNETGTLHPVQAIAQVVHDAGARLLCDLTQAVGKLPVDVGELGVDLGVFSAHKVYGPKGVGALCVGSDLRGGLGSPIEPLILGGGQESGWRGGTVNLPGVLGFARACRRTLDALPADQPRILALRDDLEAAVLEALPGARVNCRHGPRLPNTSSIGFPGVSARALIRDMDDVAVSTRSACATARSERSHVLRALGLSDHEASSCLRFSLGRFTTEQEIHYTIGKVVESVRKLRRNSSSSEV